MADNERLTPEEEDIRNQAIIQDLRYVHKNPDKAQSLERIRNRLLVTQRTFTPNSMQASRQFMYKTKQGRMQSMNAMSAPIAHKKGYYLNMLVAGVIAALLIGSLLFAVTRVYQNNTGGTGPSANLPFRYGPDWKVLVNFKGTGSKIIENQSLVFNHVLGAWFTCKGKGSTAVSLDTLHGKGFSSTCHMQLVGKLNYKLFSGTPLTTINKIYIAVDKNSSWELDLATCVGNEQRCGYPTGVPTPTPMPTSIPVPTPTHAPGSFPTPTSTIIPTPTIVPGSILPPTPTPMPYPTPTPAPGSILPPSPTPTPGSILPPSLTPTPVPSH